jgi:hypothetical protein
MPNSDPRVKQRESVRAVRLARKARRDFLELQAAALRHVGELTREDTAAMRKAGTAWGSAVLMQADAEIRAIEAWQKAKGRGVKPV